MQERIGKWEIETQKSKILIAISPQTARSDESLSVCEDKEIAS
jgi:hypothetical protein